MPVNRDKAIANLTHVLGCLIQLDPKDKVVLDTLDNRLTFSRSPKHKPEPIFTVAKRRFEDLKVGDMTYFDYTDKTWHDRTRRGVVTEVGPEHVLIFDFQAVDHQTGQVGAYRRSLKTGVSNVYVLTD